ncbi:hypothetical protein OKW43_006007 [Paraburkholderia sp. WC7.3g]
MINATVADIDRFKSDPAGNLDSAFEEEFGYQCDPTAWKQTNEAEPALPRTGRLPAVR